MSNIDDINEDIGVVDVGMSTDHARGLAQNSQCVYCSV